MYMYMKILAGLAWNWNLMRDGNGKGTSGMHKFGSVINRMQCNEMKWTLEAQEFWTGFWTLATIYNLAFILIAVR